MVQKVLKGYIKRKLEDKILKYLESQEILVVVGPRQSGKTTLLQHIHQGLGGRSVFLTFEDVRVLEIFERKTDDFMRDYVGKAHYLFIDEFQYAKNGGKILKYIYDTTNLKIIITGSSVVDLTVRAVKYLVGRIFVFNLFPLDFEEFLSFRDVNSLNFYKEHRFPGPPPLSERVNPDSEKLNKLRDLLEEFALYGGYPRVVTAVAVVEKKEVLKNIHNTYFLREVRDLLGLIDDFRLSRLIWALAWQVGSLINYNELSQTAEVSYPALKRYLSFLAKTYINVEVKPYFKNRRKEIVKNPKIYFWDSGLRNYVLDDFRDFSVRKDLGPILENLVASEAAKREWTINFWRTKRGEEIDFVFGLPGGRLTAVEVKARVTPEDQKGAAVRQFTHDYPHITLFFLSLLGNHSGTDLTPTRSLTLF